MKKYQFVIAALAAALLFTVMFYQKSIGVNLLLFEMLLIPVMIYVNRPVRFNLFTILLLISTICTAFATLIFNTGWSIVVNFILLFALSTALNYQGSRSFFHLSLETVARSFLSQIRIFQKWPQSANNGSSRSMYKWFYVVLLPILILLFFFALYISSSSTFYDKFEPLFQYIAQLNIGLIFFFILGIVVANMLLVKTIPTDIYRDDISSSDNLIRKRKHHLTSFKIDGLLTQNRAGIVLLSLLNVLILFFNCSDISTVWFNFTWDGNMLKEFVHQGTWLLVVSVIISASIALYFFHGNLNFYSKNKSLKILTIIWIVQNLVMTTSVIIRNYWYIHYFGLAYKRIAVLFFLALVVIGLICIIVKIVRVKSSYFLLRVNGLSLLFILVVSSFFNWNVVIGKHNFKHYDRSFIEYRFMAQLDDSSLPYTIKTIDELQEINRVQKKIIPFDISNSCYWDYTEYHERMKERERNFLFDYGKRSILEWNFADFRAYKKLTIN